MNEPRLTALQEAAYTFERIETMTQAQKCAAAMSLSEWKLFSARGIARLTGLSPRSVLDLSPKSDRTGGKFDPTTLPDLIELIHIRARGEVDIFRARRVLDTTSVYFAAKSTGIPKTTLQRWADQARALEAGE